MAIFFCFYFSLANSFASQTNRGLNTERPSKSDSPYTINKNRFLFESSLLSLTKNDYSKRTSYLDLSTFRYALNDDYELQLMTNPIVEFSKNGTNQRAYGESFLRFKKNIYGNDDGSHALAITGFVRVNKSPKNFINTNLRSGLIAPFLFKINQYFYFGGMVQLNHYKNQSNNHFAFINSYYLSTNITSKISSYLEFYSLKSNKKLLQNYLDFGVNYLFRPDLKLDFGLNRGVSNDADKINYFVGFAKIW
ncbi:MAG: transporter [Alphaproteobacteria bacterium]